MTGFSYVLSDLSLDDLVTEAQADPADDTAAMGEILHRFDRAACSIGRSVTAYWDLQQDAAQGARLGLVKAVRAHTPGTAGFTTYAWRYMKGAALRTINAIRTEETAVDPTEYAWPDQPHDTASVTDLEVTDLIKVLTPEQQNITKARYVSDISAADIATRLGISRPAVTQRFMTIFNTLRPVVEEALAA